MAYSSRYFVDTYFPRYFQTVRLTEVLPAFQKCAFQYLGFQTLPCDILRKSKLGGAGKATPSHKRKKILDDDEICLQAIIRCASMILGDVYGATRVIRSTM